MSCLQNEIILENIYEEVYSELVDKFAACFDNQEIEALAEKITRERFEDLAQ
mgnify:FL=1